MAADDLLFETEHWRIVLADEQYHLGRCYISLKRDCPSLSAVNASEWEDLRANVIIVLEHALCLAFGATMFNWSCLMNNAYREDPPSPHVHFHFKPRYKDSVLFNGETFIDHEFGNHYDRARQKLVSPDLFVAIASEIKKYLFS